MARGLFYVETWPSSPDRVHDYNHWYDTVHLPEVCAVEGFVSARRYEPVDGQGPYVAMYEIEADDLEAAVQSLLTAYEAGRFRMSDAIQTDPGPDTRLLRLTANCESTAHKGPPVTATC